MANTTDVKKRGLRSPGGLGSGLLDKAKKKLLRRPKRVDKALKDAGA